MNCQIRNCIFAFRNKIELLKAHKSNNKTLIILLFRVYSPLKLLTKTPQ